MFSMTGFGEGRSESSSIAVAVEIRTVNHRYLDLNCKVPSAYQRYEMELAKLVREKLKRGRVDLTVVRSSQGSNSSGLVFHEETFLEYVNVFERMLSAAKVREPGGVLSLLPLIASRRDVLEGGVEELPNESESEMVFQAVKLALEKLVAMRAQEGAALERELARLLEEFTQTVARLRELSGSVPDGFKERLKLRLDKLSGEFEIDQARLAQEIAVLADRTDVTEEMARLDSHIEQFRKLVKEPECGRKLEFLLQEMGREINTTGSKSQHMAVSPLIVEAKAILEKLREQVLNIE